MLALDTLDAQIHLTRVCVLYLVSHSLGITMMANVAFTGQRDPLLFPFAACDRFFKPMNRPIADTECRVVGSAPGAGIFKRSMYVLVDFWGHNKVWGTF